MIPTSRFARLSLAWLLSVFAANVTATGDHDLLDEAVAYIVGTNGSDGEA